MGYIILVALIALPLGVVGTFLLLLITGVIHEPAGAEAAALGYRHSWRALDH
jgi:hypothetical protein